MKLWVDDLREPPDASWTWVTTPAVAIWMLDNHGCIEISLDHDLGIDIAGNIGDTLTARPIVMWMCENGYWPRTVHVHTANPVGREWLEGMIRRYKPRDECND